MGYSIKGTIAQFVHENRRMVGLMLALSLSAPIGGVLLPKYYGALIESFAKNTRSWAKQSERIRPLIATIAGLWVVLQILYAGMDRLDSILIPKLQAYVRRHIVLDVIETYKDDHREIEVGDLVAKIVKLPLVVRDLAHQVRAFFVPAVLVGLAVGAYLFYVDPLLGCVFFACAATIVVAIVTFGRTCATQSDKMNVEDNLLHEEISDLLGNLLNVYAGDGLDIELERLEKQHHALGVEYQTTIRCASKFKAVYNLLAFAMFFIVNAVSFRLYAKKRIKLGQLTTVLMVTLFFSGRLNNAGGEIREFVFNVGVAKNVQSYLDRLHELRGDIPGTPPSTENYTVADGEIDFVDVSVVRGKKTVFDRLNLHIPARSKTAVVGRNGSGKTTLTKLLLRLAPYQGAVRIDGRDIATLSPEQLRRQIIYIPQHPQLFNRSVYENIAYGVKGVSPDTVRRVLERYSLDEILGHRLDQPVGKNGERLSGGQRQLVYLLRCVLRSESPNPPALVVMDEPTAALDQDNKEQVFAALAAIMRDKTVILVTHDPYLLRFADQVVELGA